MNESSLTDRLFSRKCLEGMLGDDGEATIDGIHFTDIGMTRYADLICPIIERYLTE